jgi:hypothetical protein
MSAVLTGNPQLSLFGKNDHEILKGVIDSVLNNQILVVSRHMEWATFLIGFGINFCHLVKVFQKESGILTVQHFSVWKGFFECTSACAKDDFSKLFPPMKGIR